MIAFGIMTGHSIPLKTPYTTKQIQPIRLIILIFLISLSKKLKTIKKEAA